jgi:rhodanese-related sulfurtransferase
MVTEISVQELAEKLGAGNPPLVLDVREPEEIQLARFPGAQHIPMNDVPGRVAEVDRSREIVVVCHHGMRSAHVAHYLDEQGFPRVANLSGGIDAWSAVIDPSVPRY